MAQPEPQPADAPTATTASERKQVSVLLISPAHMQAPAEQLYGYLSGQANLTPTGTCDGGEFLNLLNAFVGVAKQDFPDTY
jgi:hypothetical protein